MMAKVEDIIRHGPGVELFMQTTALQAIIAIVSQSVVSDSPESPRVPSIRAKATVVSSL